jgi:hypothetical protein
MVGRNGLFSGYKIQRTKGHRGTERKRNTKKDWERNRTRGNFWSINQQHLVLLPPLSSP